MEYQKSMMKIMQNLLESGREEKSIERIIYETKSGRTSSFNALKWLEKNGFISIKSSGNQKLVKPIIDNYSLQFKYYFDSIKFKEINPLIKLIVRIFISDLPKKVKFAVLFGSVLNKKEFNDIDLLLVGDAINNNDLKLLSKLRNKIERVFGIILNIHKGEADIDNLFKGIVIYQSSYIFIQNDSQRQYMEYLEWIFETIKDPSNMQAFENSKINLSYSYCYLKNFFPKDKSDALDFFNKNYKVKTLKELKKIGSEIGKKLFK